MQIATRKFSSHSTHQELLTPKILEKSSARPGPKIIRYTKSPWSLNLNLAGLYFKIIELSCYLRLTEKCFEWVWKLLIARVQLIGFKGHSKLRKGESSWTTFVQNSLLILSKLFFIKQSESIKSTNETRSKCEILSRFQSKSAS